MNYIEAGSWETSGNRASKLKKKKKERGAQGIDKVESEQGALKREEKMKKIYSNNGGKKKRDWK